MSGDDRFMAAFSLIVVNFLLNVSRFSSGTTPTSGGCTPPSSSTRSSSTNPTMPDSSSSTCLDPPGTPTEMKTVSSTLRVAHFHLIHQISESFRHVGVFLKPAFFLKASRGQLHWFRFINKINCKYIYEKITHLSDIKAGYECVNVLLCCG